MFEEEIEEKKILLERTINLPVITCSLHLQTESLSKIINEAHQKLLEHKTETIDTDIEEDSQE
jgi:hypothetical protein